MISNLNNLPKNYDTHHWADYIEILCLADKAGEVSIADILDRVKEIKDLERVSANIPGVGKAELDDIWQNRALEWFEHFPYRIEAFNSSYPFNLSDDGKTLIRKRPIASLRKLYIFFLLSSNLRCLEKVFYNRFAGAFEYACLTALNEYMSDGSKVYMFGKNIYNNQSRYSGQLWSKILRLASDLGEKVIVEEEEFNPTDTGDNGLDVVGWVPFKDSAQGRLLVFSQCTCRPDWEGKQYQSSPMNWSNIISFTAPPANFMFIPYCFRKPSGGWYKIRDIKETTLIDRERLITLLRDKHRSLRKIIYELAEKAVEYNESIF